MLPLHPGQKESGHVSRFRLIRCPTHGLDPGLDPAVDAATVSVQDGHGSPFEG